MLLLDDGTVLAAGGDNGGPALASSEVYSPATMTWAATVQPMGVAREYFQMVVLLA